MVCSQAEHGKVTYGSSGRHRVQDFDSERDRDGNVNFQHETGENWIMTIGER